MFKIYKYIILLVCLAVVAVAGVLVYYHFNSEPEYIVEKGKIADIRQMARLCSVDIYREVVVVDTVGTKVMCAIQKQQGSVTFDLDSLASDLSADTVRVVLPRETVEINESTEPNSWQVIDTRNMSLIGSGTFTAAEDNAVKSKLKARAIRSVYKDGIVKRARAEARENLRNLLAQLTGKPVIVSDPAPEGYGPK